MNLRALATILTDIADKGESRYDQVENIEKALSVALGQQTFASLDQEFRESDEGKKLNLLMALEVGSEAIKKTGSYKVDHNRTVSLRKPRVGKKSAKPGKKSETSRKSVNK